MRDARRRAAVVAGRRCHRVAVAGRDRRRVLLLRLCAAPADVSRVRLPLRRCARGPLLQSAPQPDLARYRARQAARSWKHRPGSTRARASRAFRWRRDGDAGRIAACAAGSAASAAATRPQPRRRRAMIACWPRFALLLAPGAPARSRSRCRRRRTPACAQHLGACCRSTRDCVDDGGRPCAWATASGPASRCVLVPGYYRCPQLCGLVMQGVLKRWRPAACRARQLAHRRASASTRADTPADAHAPARRRSAPTPLRSQAPRRRRAAHLDLLIADARATSRRTRATRWASATAQPTPRRRRRAHRAPRRLVVPTPDGRVARYFPGVRFDPRELRAALVEAGDGQRRRARSSASPLLCAHFDPRTGRHSVAVMTPLRVARRCAALARWPCGSGGAARAGSEPMNDTDARLASGLQLLQHGASSIAGRTDLLFVAMLLLCGAMALVLAGADRRVLRALPRGARGRPQRRAGSDAGGLEVAWTVDAAAALPRHLRLGRARLRRPVPRAAPTRCRSTWSAKQWMWKLQHRNGRREINELHVPLGQPVRLVMTSQDAIHSFFVPAFRLKQDVVPGRYTRLWFTRHAARRVPPVLRRVLRQRASQMIGPRRGDAAGRLRALARQPAPAEPGWRSTASRCSASYGCSGCHDAGSTVHAPLAATACSAARCTCRTAAPWSPTTTTCATPSCCPRKDVVAGFAPVMPSLRRPGRARRTCRR